MLLGIIGALFRGLLNPSIPYCGDVRKTHWGGPYIGHPWHWEERVFRTRTEKSFRNLIKSTWNQIVFTIFQLIWNQTDTFVCFQINWKMVNTIWFQIDLIRFFCVCKFHQSGCYGISRKCPVNAVEKTLNKRRNSEAFLDWDTFLPLTFMWAKLTLPPLPVFPWSSRYTSIFMIFEKFQRSGVP